MVSVPAQPTRGEALDADTRYVGLATRVVAFAIDATLISAVTLIVDGAGALILSLLHLPKEVRTVIVAIAGAASIAWSVGYFVVFWSTTGQTPGARLMQIRLLTPTGDPVAPSRALLRVVGLFLAALPLFLGYVRILYDEKRRGFSDRLARTVVIQAAQPSVATLRRAQKRAIYEATRRPRTGPPR